MALNVRRRTDWAAAHRAGCRHRSLLPIPTVAGVLQRFIADLLSAKRYDHRIIVLETVAPVPGMVGATLTHLRCVRRAAVDRGWVQPRQCQSGVARS